MVPLLWTSYRNHHDSASLLPPTSSIPCPPPLQDLYGRTPMSVPGSGYGAYAGGVYPGYTAPGYGVPGQAYPEGEEGCLGGGGGEGGEGGAC